MILTYITDNRIYVIILLSLAILNILDGYSTYLVVKNGSLKNEKNPIARLIFKKMGLSKGIILAKSIILISLFVYYNLYKTSDIVTIISLSAMNILYMLVVINNYKIYFSIKKNRKFWT
jgi:hypothetical protein